MLNLFFRNGTRTCAISSVFYLLKELGKNKSLYEIQTNIEISENGSNASHICEYMEKLNISHIVFKTNNLKNIFSLISPGKRCAILHVDNGTHFLFVKKKNDGTLIVFDGKDFIQGDIENKLKERFSGFVIMAGKDVKWITSLIMLKKTLFLLLIVILGIALGRFCKKYITPSSL
ncbi:MAG: hypothetical protein JXA96_09780 [Sedimentisphaerales bacterium]|nr:hypothetical protein [Sedimentisphaerales bacterium]